MAGLTIGDFTRSRLAMPTIAPNLSGAELLQDVSRRLDKVVDTSIQDWQKAEVVKAESEGLADGASNSIQYRKSGTLTGDAYKKNADATRMNMLGVESQLTFKELKETYSADPAGFIEQSNEYITKTVDSLEGNPEGQALMEGQLKLKQQADGYAIKKRFDNVEADKFKTSTESLIHSMKTSAYETAGEVFSKDPDSQALALNQFGLSKKLLVGSLNAVTAQGTPVYSEVEKTKISDQFHTDFYTRAAEDYFENNDLDSNNMADLLEGKLEISIPGTDQKINILNEVGVDVYDKDVKKAAINSMNERNVTDKRARVEAKAQMKVDQDSANFSIMTDLKTGGTVSVNMVNQLVKAGTITAAQGNKMIDEVLDPSTYDNPFIVAEINDAITKGEDASQMIANGGLAPKTYIQLMKANSSALSTETEGLDKENMRMIKGEFQDVGQFGFATAEEVRTTNDIIAIYQRNRQEGMDSELALEKARVLIDIAKDKELKRVSPRLRIGVDKKVDVQATVNGLQKDFKEHVITEDEFDTQLAILTKLMNEG